MQDMYHQVAVGPRFYIGLLRHDTCAKNGMELLTDYRNSGMHENSANQR